MNIVKTLLAITVASATGSLIAQDATSSPAPATQAPQDSTAKDAAGGAGGNAAAGGAKKDPAVIFKKKDKNGDGKLELEELVSDTTSPKGMKQAKMFKKLDTNGDGTLSLEEFSQSAMFTGKKAGGAAAGGGGGAGAATGTGGGE